MLEIIDLVALKNLVHRAKRLAKQYREITGKPLGITGEVGEFVAADLLGLKLAEARQSGYDAIAPDGRKVQIKSRCILPDSKPGQRIGRIRLDYEWDTVMLVLIDIDYKPIAIYEAQREEIKKALTKPGSKSRNERGALGISKFKSISSLLWSRA